MDYNAYVQQIATMAVVPTNDPNFQIILPQMINYAELRIQRDLDLLSTQVENTSYTLTAGNNQLAILTADFVTLQTVQIVYQNRRYPLLPVSKEYLMNAWNDGSVLGMPTVFAVFGGDAATTGYTYQNIIVGPYPNNSYILAITGTAREAPLSALNTSTFISTYLPDLFIMASMIYISAYQRNFGRESDDPAMAQSYENQYQLLLKGAIGEEYRKKFQASAWSSVSQSPVATPTRG